MVIQYERDIKMVQFRLMALRLIALQEYGDFARLLQNIRGAERCCYYIGILNGCNSNINARGGGNSGIKGF
jgi:hypothetical protein